RRLALIRQTSPLTLLAMTWSAFCILFFTVSKSKLPGYVLPAIPAITLLIARLLSDIDFVPRRISSALVVTTSVIVLLTVGSSRLILHRFSLDSFWTKSVARQLQANVRSPEALRSFGLRRSEQYGLNFYLHREVPDWVGNELHDGYVVTNG